MNTAAATILMISQTLSTVDVVSDDHYLTAGDVSHGYPVLGIHFENYSFAGGGVRRGPFMAGLVVNDQSETRITSAVQGHLGATHQVSDSVAISFRQVLNADQFSSSGAGFGPATVSVSLTF